jgi:N-acetylmuramoyl-L-alanine amidase
LVKINPMHIRFCFIKIALAGLFLFGFIARTANTEELSLEQKALSVNVALQNIAGEKWITLPDFAFLLKGSLKEDLVSRRSEITFKDHRLVFLPESKKALYDDQITEMKQPTRLVSGVMVIPFSFASLVANLAFTPAPKPAPVFQPVSTEKPEPEIKTPDETPAPQTTPANAPTVAEILAAPAVDKNREFVLVIDAGHGDQDSGAIGPWGLKEKDVNLDLTLRLADYLKKNRPRIKVVLTRDKDTFLPLEERTQIANSLNADMFVCIHTNSSKVNRDSASGVETFYPRSKPALYASANTSGDEIASLLKQGGDILQRSQYLAALIQENLTDIFIKDIVPDRGIKGHSFFVLKYTNMVSVLVEVGFICNQNIEANLRIPAVRQEIATAIGRGIEAYLDGRPLKSSISVDSGVVEEQSYE